MIVKSKTSPSIKRQIRHLVSDQGFNRLIGFFESLISKTLAIGMMIVIIVAVSDLSRVLIQDILLEPRPFLNKTLMELFGLFLSVLIAIELLQNIAAYLKHHAVQLELVIITSLTAVARKIILLDLEKIDGVELIGLSVAVFALAISYGIVTYCNKRK